MCAIITPIPRPRRVSHEDEPDYECYHGERECDYVWAAIESDRKPGSEPNRGPPRGPNCKSDCKPGPQPGYQLAHDLGREPAADERDREQEGERDRNDRRDGVGHALLNQPSGAVDACRAGGGPATEPDQETTHEPERTALKRDHGHADKPGRDGHRRDHRKHEAAQESGGEPDREQPYDSLASGGSAQATEVEPTEIDLRS
ncbi:MAG: hypothetical protein ACRDQ9_21050 [Pseudonocardiaceae bacterium]